MTEPEEHEERARPLTAPDSPLLRDAQAFAMHWPETATDYVVSVAPPLGPPPSRPLPVLYVLDADILFASAVQAARLLALDPTAPPIEPMLVVGIGWADVAGAPAYGYLRYRDFSPPGARFPAIVSGRLPPALASGGAPALRRFIENKVAPFVAERHAVAASPATLFAYSYGVCFALDALLDGCALFGDMILGSPGLAHADDPLFARARGWRPARAARLLFTFGSAEADGPSDAYRAMARNSRAMADLLAARGAETTWLTLDGESHNSGPVRSLIAGLTRFRRAVP